MQTELNTPLRPIQLNHGPIKTKRDYITALCPNCYRKIQHAADRCRCGQMLIKK